MVFDVQYGARVNHGWYGIYTKSERYDESQQSPNSPVGTENAVPWAMLDWGTYNLFVNRVDPETIDTCLC